MDQNPFSGCGSDHPLPAAAGFLKFLCIEVGSHSQRVARLAELRILRDFLFVLSPSDSGRVLAGAIQQLPLQVVHLNGVDSA